MARLGRQAYALLLELGDIERAARLSRETYVLESGAAYPEELLVELATEGLVSIRSAADGPQEGSEAGRLIRVEALGRQRLEEALSRGWNLAASGASETTPSFWHEFVDPVTRARFVVNVADATGEDEALRIAVDVLSSPGVRDRARALERTGWERGLTLETEDGSSRVRIWRKQ